MNKANRLFLPLLAAVAFLLAGCASEGNTARGHSHATTQSDIAGLSGKTWLLAGYRAETQFIPLEPGQGSTARLVFGRDGSLSGSTGNNTFSGSWNLQGKNRAGTYAFKLTISGLTRIKAPNDTAARFEKDLISQLAAAKALKKGKDFIQLLDGRNEILVQFIYRASGDQF